jgi:hypothetical protein
MWPCTQHKLFDNEFDLRDDIERQQASGGSLIFERGQSHQRRQSAGSHDSGGLEKQQTCGTQQLQGETYEKGKTDKGELLACSVLPCIPSSWDTVNSERIS